MQFLTNHIGYETNGPKSAVVLVDFDESTPSSVDLVCALTGATVASMEVPAAEKVANWHQGLFAKIDFSSFSKSGRFFLRADTLQSSVFEIGTQLLNNTTTSDLLHYFKSQRCTGIFDQADKQAPIVGSDRRVDVSGGWYDASGDVSKYLSHLSYANYLNPQQIPMVVWNMLKGLSLHQNHDAIAAFTKIRLQEEALFGADFLVRMFDDAGFFYMTVFDKWSKDTKQREICAYETQQGHKMEDFQAGFRQGAGVSIAALAAAARLSEHGEFDQNTYLQTAEKAYWHLVDNNLKYLNNGEENIIDEYCALLAAVELYRTTKQQRYLVQAEQWLTRLISRQQGDEQFQSYWSANGDGSRPYFHAAEAGLPVITICEFMDAAPSSTLFEQAKSAVNRAVEFELAVTSKVHNPFGYPRQYIKPLNAEKRDAFFVAQDNESGYWWQGENARLGSMASMAYLAAPFVTDDSTRQQLNEFAQSALNWVLGLNPYDMCMLDGHGRNNPDYLPQLGFYNAKGGICNGITAGFDDAEDIAFNPEGQKDDMLQNWRWGEQWIPHGAWYLLAVLTQSYSTIRES